MQHFAGSIRALFSRSSHDAGRRRPVVQYLPAKGFLWAADRNDRVYKCIDSYKIYPPWRAPSLLTGLQDSCSSCLKNFFLSYAALHLLSINKGHVSRPWFEHWLRLNRCGANFATFFQTRFTGLSCLSCLKN